MDNEGEQEEGFHWSKRERDRERKKERGRERKKGRELK